MIDNSDVVEEDLIKRVEQELNNICSIRESLMGVMKNFDTQTKILMNIEKRVRDLEMKYENMTNDKNPSSVMYR